MHFDGAWRETRELRDGTRVTLRLIRADDRELLGAAFRRLSPESRYRRFLSSAPELTDAMLDYLTQVDGRDHVAIVALHESLDLKEERIVGVSRFVRTAEDPEVAEAAVTVVDDMQHKGLATALSGPTRDAALERGITRFRAEVLVENAPMRRLLEEAGARPLEEGAGTLVFDVPLAEPQSSLQRVLAAVTAEMATLIRRFAPPG